MFVTAGCRQGCFLQRETVDEGVKGCVRMAGERERESRLAETSENGIMVAQRGHPGVRPALHQRRRPAVRSQNPAHRPATWR